MKTSWAGVLVAGLIVAGVVGILALNFQPGSEHTLRQASPAVPGDGPTVAPSLAQPSGPGAREYPIGEPVVRNHVQVAAVWLAGVTMDGMTSAADLVHLEADIRAIEDNPNGFAKDEFVPYLKVGYTLVDASTGALIGSGSMGPMVASDGLHYGASVAMLRPGRYRLVYRIDPPSSGGLGRHVGLGGVAPWWEPFDATFEWTVEPATAPTLAGAR